MFATVTLGVDVSKRHLDLHLLPAGTRLRVGNDPAGHDRLLAFVRGAPPERVVLEATGGYETALLHRLVDEKVPVARVNPLDVRRFAGLSGIRAKTDRLDAKVLALFGQRVETRVVDPACKIRHVLKQLVARRRQIVEQVVQLRNRLEHADVPAVAESIGRSVKAEKAELATVEKLILAEIEANPEFKARYEKLTAAVGVGPAVAAVLVSELPELGTLHRTAMAAIVGVAPFADDSAGHHGRRSIRGGRHTARCAIYMSTLVAIRHEEHLRAHYRQLVARGKHKKVALVACMNKRVAYLNSLVRVKKEQPKA